ncbi:hypothetical protein F5148DRAFT_695498 [Russula earlei]|uniref:Uncharacterized protein n=1 Tax=Russula earlei TaxID=71964 RepID=A0ACC0UFJ7_9AGAM|nr:hypothetical protein F5148DRAFT_695498 [Russula earlei]
MTTPTSSATTPSPQMAVLHTTPVSMVAALSSGDVDATEREARKQAVQKFLARAEISKLTRGLRARLSYATYKATHNVAHLPIGDLESHAKDDALATWTPSRNSYGDGATIQGKNVANPSGGTARKGAMAPPTTIPSSHSRSHQASPGKRGSISANATQSLYASILAPPPAKRARTIHNPEDPPIPAPARMTNGTSRNRKRSSHPEASRGTHSRVPSESQPYSSVAENTRAHARTSRDNKRKAASKGTKASGQRRNVNASNVDSAHDVDVDMKAAATLTRLLHHSRNSITSLSAVSPRSSMSAGSDVGSSQSHSQFAQSSDRTTTAQTSLASSQESPNTGSIARPATPPRSLNAHLTPGANTFPDGGSASATDQEAIKLLYYLRESPSPARPSTVRSRDGQDAASLRTLTDSSDLKAQGRVLFPTSSGGVTDVPLAYRMLTRDNSGSSISSTAAMEIPASRSLTREPTLVIDPPVGDVELPQHSDLSIRTGNDSDIPPVTKVTPPTPIDTPHMSQLLPPPSSPQRNIQSSNSTLPASPISEHKAHHTAPATPGTYTFNLNDFINVSPSPAGPHRIAAPYKQNLSGIRSGGGRKLFAEEQAEQLIGVEETSRVGEHPNTALGAGIHLTRF